MLYNLNNPFEVEKFKQKCNSLLEDKCIVDLSKKHRNRTSSQNRYLHLLLGYFASEFGYSLEEVKYDIFKRKCNPDIFKVERVNKRGKKVTALRSSRDLDTAEMTTAIERFRNWSSAVAGLYLPSAGEEQALIYAQQQIEKYEQYL